MIRSLPGGEAVLGVLAVLAVIEQSAWKQLAHTLPRPTNYRPSGRTTMGFPVNISNNLLPTSLSHLVLKNYANSSTLAELYGTFKEWEPCCGW